MSRPKIFARFRHERCHDIGTNWLVLSELGQFSNSSQTRQAHDFALDLDQYPLIVSRAYSVADAYRTNPDWAIEIVMIRNGIETIVDLENEMQMLALATTE